MRQFMSHPELEVLKSSVQIQKDEGHLLLRQQDVQRVLVILLFAPHHRHDDCAIRFKFANEMLIREDGLTAQTDASAHL